MAMAESREYFWGCELTKEKSEVEWTFAEEDGDSDYMMHTLFLKHAVLGASAVSGERNIISIETTNFEKEPLSQPLFSLTMGLTENCYSDLSFTHNNPVKFKLTEGSGPVYLSAQQLVEYPEDPNLSQDETGFTDEELDEAEEDEEQSPKKDLKITKKRKASSQKEGKGKQRGKFQEEEDEEEEDDEEEDEDMEEQDEEEDEEDDSDEDDSEESPVKTKKKVAKPKAQRKVEVKKEKVVKTKAAKKGGKKK